MSDLAKNNFKELDETNFSATSTDGLKLYSDDNLIKSFKFHHFDYQAAACDVPASVKGSYEAKPVNYLQDVSKENTIAVDDFKQKNTHENNICKKADLLCMFAWKLAIAGAETRLVMNSLHKLAKLFEFKDHELIVTRSCVMIKVFDEGRQYISTRRIENYGISMDGVATLNHIFLKVLNEKIMDVDVIASMITKVKVHKYNKNFLIFIEALAGGCFAYLNGGDAKVVAAALVGGVVLMFTRFWFISKGFFAVFAFMACAFCGCSTTLLVSRFALGATTQELELATMATTLLLVPGYPIMNGFLDAFKGYLETGLFRLVHSAILTAAAAIGLLGALWFTGTISNV